MLGALFAYEPLLLLLGLMGAIRGWRQREPLEQFLSLWTGIVLLLALIYPAREVDSLAWVIIPMGILAVREFMHYAIRTVAGFQNTINQGILTFVILVFTWLNLEGISNSLATGASPVPEITAIVVASVILVAASLLIAWGWASNIAGRGFMWGLCLFMLIYSFSMTTAAGAMRLQYTSELWTQGNSLPQVNLLVNTINELSVTHTNVQNNLDIVVVGLQSPGLEWALHQFPGTIFTSSLAAGTKPSIVITEQKVEPSLAASYRGDGFELLQQPEWSLLSPDQYLQWIIYHSAPQQVQKVILWAREDLFPGGSLSTTPNQTP